jgi:hypothetical protein
MFQVDMRDIDWRIRASSVAAAWYAVNALAATLALVPREEPGVWVVKRRWDGDDWYVTSEVEGPPWTTLQRDAHRCPKRVAVVLASLYEGARVVRLRARAGRGGAK